MNMEKYRPIADTLTYLTWVAGLEGVLRLAPFILLPEALAIAVSIVLFTLIHALFFKWPMVLYAAVFSALVCAIYTMLPLTTSYLVGVVLHFILGLFNQVNGFNKKTRKEGGMV